jgi:fructan beta-fructosidase
MGMQKIINSIVMISLLGFLSCGKKQAETSNTRVSYNEAHRPQFHFSPPTNWMNDPNGMVYYEGEYHLFYQHYPDSNVWGPMHWGHAVSKDMVRWQHLPIALYPDSLGYIFSGSAVIDYKNTAGFGSTDKPAMVAIFTYHLMEGEKAKRNDFQTQGIAYSTDKGRTWKKYVGNPVIKNPSKRDFRDPKVFWNEGSHQWVMILAVNDHVELYGSANLREWKQLSNFGNDVGAHGGVWECPDLFEMQIAGTGEKKWVMLVNINPGAYNGGSGTQYFIGRFDGKNFQADSKETHWLDYGKDNYAGVTWNNIPEKNGRRLFLGWMSNWQYATVVPTTVWRSATTVPRQLSLVNTEKGLRVASNPVVELESLREGVALEIPVLLNSTDSVSKEMELPKKEVEMNIEIERESVDKSFEMELSNTKGERLLIGLQAGGNQFYIDRTKSGIDHFSTDFAGRHYGPRSSTSKNIQLKLLLDASSIELFADDGSIVMTEIFFATEKYTHLKIRARSQGITTKSIQVFSLQSIWPTETLK